MRREQGILQLYGRRFPLASFDTLEQAPQVVAALRRSNDKRRAEDPSRAGNGGDRGQLYEKQSRRLIITI